MYTTLPNNQIFSGFSYLTRGAALLLQPGMRRFVLIPFVANCVVFILLTFWLIQHFSLIESWLTGWLPTWEWLSYIVAFISGLIIFFILAIYGYSFTVLTNIIAAPFYGRLAEKIEEHVCQQALPEETLASMVARTLKREMIKLWYFISRGLVIMIGLFFLSFIPLLNLLAPLLGLAWATWVMTLQYIDYPADNHQMPFTSLRQRLKQQRFSFFGFGGCVMLGSMIPVVNIIIMPIAVAGGTLFWINELRQAAIESKVLEPINF